MSTHELTHGTTVELARFTPRTLNVENQVSTLQLSVVIPTFNEAQNLEELVRRLCAALDARLPGAYELLVVDDDSPDRTWEHATRLMEHYPALRVLRRRGETGLASAVIRGWQAAHGEVLAVIDADLQHPPEVISKLWEAMGEYTDVVVASRHTEDGGVGRWSLLRRLASRGAQLLGWCVLPKVVGRVSDPMSGFFLVRRSAIAGVELKPLGYKILLEVLGRARVERVAEVGYEFAERRAGESKVRPRVYLEYLAQLLQLRLATVPDRFLKYCAVGLSGVVVDMAIFAALAGVLGLSIGKALSAEAAIASNFMLNDVWTFRDVSRRQGNGQARFARFAKYNAICAAGVVIGILLIKFQVAALHLGPNVANAIAIGIVTLWNFWMSKTFSWELPRRSAVR
jgi:dolichol-phosphate mannosyltransferase